MRLLLAVDSITTLEILLNEISARSWPQGTEARVLSIVEALKISGEVIGGRTARRIIDRAKNWHADLIAVGTLQRRGLKRLLLGSTFAAVAKGAHCSVRIIRGGGVSHSESLDRSERSKKNQLIAYKSIGLRKAA